MYFVRNKNCIHGSHHKFEFFIKGHAKQDPEANHMEQPKTNELRKRLEHVESERKSKEDYQMAKKKYEKKKKELDSKLEVICLLLYIDV